MPLCPRLNQRVQYAAPNPVVRVCVNPNARCDFVRDAKTDSRDILRQFIRILLHELIQLHAILLIDFECHRV